MRPFFRLISRYLLLLILASVLSPGFAGEIAREMAEGAHQQNESVAMAVVDHDGCHETSGAPDHGSQPSDAGCCTDSLHHCCPGHQLGHLSALDFVALPPASPLLVGMAVSEAFLTRVPEGLERPPRSISV